MLFKILGIALLFGHNHPDTIQDSFPVHQDITATVFWVGEKGNTSSSWDEDWVARFGGIDDPENRHGWYPKNFEPQENPFYVALPYSEFAPGGRKSEAADLIYWSNEKAFGRKESMCKNRWVAIERDGIICYAQWEDTGPFITDDAAYVFGNARPSNRHNDSAGIDVSPAVRDFLEFDGMAKVAWKFVAEAEVPDGPWKEVVTTSGTNWK